MWPQATSAWGLKQLVCAWGRKLLVYICIYTYMYVCVPVEEPGKTMRVWSLCISPPLYVLLLPLCTDAVIKLSPVDRTQNRHFGLRMQKICVSVLFVLLFVVYMCFRTTSDVRYWYMRPWGTSEWAFKILVHVWRLLVLWMSPETHTTSGWGHKLRVYKTLRYVRP